MKEREKKDEYSAEDRGPGVPDEIHTEDTDQDAGRPA
jgi:hypothetical protein